MSASCEEVFQRDKDFTLHDARFLNVDALRIDKGARVCLAKMNAQTSVLQFVSEVTMCGLDDFGIAIFHHESVSCGATTNRAVSDPAESSFLRAGYNKISTIRVGRARSDLTGDVVWFPRAGGERPAPMRSVGLSAESLSNLVP